MKDLSDIKTSGRLTGKVAFLTGAASGIGKATAKLMAAEGANVVIVDINNDGELVSQEINQDGGKALFIKTDVSKVEDVQNAVDKAISEFQQIDILFNNAGIAKRTNILNTSIEEWDKAISVNLRSVFLVSKFVIPEIIKAGGGTIVNTGYGWGLKGGGDAISYCATKGAIVNMTRAMAIDHAQHNIRVNCVCPGDTLTELLLSEGEQLGMEKQAFLEESADRPMNRLGSPYEIAQAVLYLSSDESSFVTGTSLVVDGGGIA